MSAVDFLHHLMSDEPLTATEEVPTLYDETIDRPTKPATVPRHYEGTSYKIVSFSIRTLERRLKKLNSR